MDKLIYKDLLLNVLVFSGRVLFFFFLNLIIIRLNRWIIVWFIVDIKGLIYLLRIRVYFNYL